MCISKRINVLVSKVSEFMYLEMSFRAQTYRKKMLEIRSESPTNGRELHRVITERLNLLTSVTLKI